jgi:hypothetical protein
VDTDTSPQTGVPPPARLVIHAEHLASASGRPFDPPLRHTRTSDPGGARNGQRAPLSLRIDNLKGLRVHAVDDAGPLIDVPLPPGTYHVTMQFGTVRRSYTMTLEPGASFDLYLRLAPHL